MCVCVCSFHRLPRSQIFRLNPRLRKQLFKNKQNRLICFSESSFWSLKITEASLNFFERSSLEIKSLGV